MASSKSGPFRVFFGDEDFLLDQALNRFRSHKTRSVILLDGEAIDGQQVVSICETRSFDGQLRIVIIDHAQKVKAAEPLLKYVEGKDSKDRTVILVAVVRAPRLSPAWLKAMRPKGKCVECLQPKPWKEKERVQRVAEQAKRLELKLDNGVAELLIKILGYDLRLITNELQKLSYLADGEVATKKHVGQLVPHVFPVMPYEVAEAAVGKKVKSAMTKLGLVYRNLGEGAAVPVTHSLVRIVEKLIIARSMLDAKDAVKVIAQRLSMHEYPLKLNLLPLARLHTVDQLRGQMKTLCRLDALVKGSARSKRTQVELAVLSIAT